jgi:hypothetical protein
MEFKMRFDCDNAAFDDMPEMEIARILRATADKIEAGGVGYNRYQNVRDINGNIVGTYRHKEI